MSYHISRFFERFESRWKLDVAVKDIYQTLRLKIILLEDFFMDESKWDIYDENLRVHVGKIKQVVDDTAENIIMSKGKFWTLPEKMCCRISGIIEKLDYMIKPYIGQIYAAVSKSRRPSTCSEIYLVIDRAQKLLKHMENLFSQMASSFCPLSREMEALGENLWYLQVLLKLSEPECIKCELLQGLVEHTQSVTDRAACLLYLCYEETKMDDDIVNVMKDKICCLVQEVKPFQLSVREIYMEALKTSELSLQDCILVDEPVVLFLYALLGHMIDLSKARASFKRSVMDQVEALHEELQIMRNYLFDPSASKYNQSNEKVNNLLLHIKFVLCQAAYAVYTSYDSDITEEVAVKLNLRISDLLQEMEVIKKEAREIYDDIIAKSPRFNLAKTNELGFMDFVIQNLHELLNSKADPVLQLQHQMETVLGTILSLREDLFEIGKWFQEQGKQTDPWSRFIDVMYQSEFFIDSFIASSHRWECKLGLFDILQQIKMISREVNALEIKRTSDTLVLKFSIDLGGASSVACSENPVASPGHILED